MCVYSIDTWQSSACSPHFLIHNTQCQRNDEETQKAKRRKQNAQTHISSTSTSTRKMGLRKKSANEKQFTLHNVRRLRFVIHEKIWLNSKNGAITLKKNITWNEVVKIVDTSNTNTHTHTVQCFKHGNAKSSTSIHRVSSARFYWKALMFSCFFCSVFVRSCVRVFVQFFLFFVSFRFVSCECVFWHER